MSTSTPKLLSKAAMNAKNSLMMSSYRARREPTRLLLSSGDSSPLQQQPTPPTPTSDEDDGAPLTVLDVQRRRRRVKKRSSDSDCPLLAPEKPTPCCNNPHCQAEQLEVYQKELAKYHEERRRRQKAERMVKRARRCIEDDTTTTESESEGDRKKANILMMPSPAVSEISTTENVLVLDTVISDDFRNAIQSVVKKVNPELELNVPSLRMLNGIMTKLVAAIGREAARASTKRESRPVITDTEILNACRYMFNAHRLVEIEQMADMHLREWRRSLTEEMARLHQERVNKKHREYAEMFRRHSQ